MHGQKLFTFEGHEAPVYSICPHHKESIQVCCLSNMYTSTFHSGCNTNICC